MQFQANEMVRHRSKGSTSMRRILHFALILMIAPAVAVAEDRLIETEGGPVKVETLARGLDHPWALASLPDGRMLVTERAGWLRSVAKEGGLSEPISGVPEVV